ncbi:MAG TPA: ribosomal protein S18-alanine N-acetyltransferase [Anaerolineales bacterium]|jgi:ribosomal-protein-alanine N-acetyltransferase|nr:ribosomal protein S18-alanine N-acetyltransferase [Anaerolineales bacterium]HMR99903.1 ribosomal protein S18-alanine N-acetyltransferase [Anaerolineales bacterium]HNQ95689.1 ribosomal protein S18-alanine N-acetyltransferase [Anaerolineales bacterium]HNS61510.1 ribosomal protein S18-alanine N-acetyltransferase [Anaerolineales bacterium]
MNIRRMTLEDLAQVIAIDQVSFSLPWPERSFRFEITDNPASRAWIAEEDGKIVGMIVAWLLVDEAHIATIATHPEFRRRGVASKLLIHALEYMRSEGAVTSVLEVRESNAAAQEMYRKFGFEESGRRPRYYKDNSEDAILMTLENISVVE